MSRMKHAYVALCMALSACAAQAQTPGTLTTGPLATTGPTNNLNAAFATKADVVEVAARAAAITAEAATRAGADTTLTTAAAAAQTTANAALPKVGTTTNDNAAAGQIGEYVSATVLTGAPITCANTNIPRTVTSASLTAGDWEVRGTAYFVYGTATPTGLSVAVGLVANASPVTPAQGTVNAFAAIPFTGSPVGLNSGTTRISLAATTTVYMTVTAQYPGTGAGVPPNAFGMLEARRVR
jgi:hypothetical protein